MEEKKENSLSERDKERIKQAVLESAAKNTNLKPNEVATQLCEAFTSIQAYTYSKSQQYWCFHQAIQVQLKVL